MLQTIKNIAFVLPNSTTKQTDILLKNLSLSLTNAHWNPAQFIST